MKQGRTAPSSTTPTSARRSSASSRSSATAYPDPSAEGGPWVSVDMKALTPLKRPVTLAEMKADPALAAMALVRYSRLSVCPRHPRGMEIRQRPGQEARLRTLCRVEEITDGASRGFPPAPGSFTGLFAVRRGNQVFAYVNACPHIGVALDWAPDDFLTRDGAHIVCAVHGALFEIDGGRCIARPLHERPPGTSPRQNRERNHTGARRRRTIACTQRRRPSGDAR